jgi:methyl-accepting chemotaxis protein
MARARADRMMNGISTSARPRGRFGLRGRIALLGALVLALAAGALGRVVQLDGWSAFASLGGAIVVAIGVVLVSIDRHVTRSLARLRLTVETMTRGDLSLRVDAIGTDAFGAIAGSLDEMNAGMSALVADIRSESTFVSQAGEALAAGTGEFAQRTER